VAIRQIPRPFQYAWGGGHVVEEVSFDGEHKESAIQLLEYEDGTVDVRFCFYAGGRFQRNPLLLNEGEIDELANQLDRAPRLRALLARLSR